MRLWKQTVLALGLCAVALVGVAVFVPSARPVLDRMGLAGVLDQLGPSTADQAQTGAPTQRGGGAGGPTRVVAVPYKVQPLQSSVAAIGTTRGVNAVNMASEVTGRIAQMAVASGDRVEVGTLIAELNSDSARISFDRARIELAQAQTELDRLKLLRSSGNGTELQVSQAEVVLQQAELQLREAEYVLGQHRITAPISGWVGIVDSTPGRLLSAGSEIARIEDRSSLLVDFRVPERVVSSLKVGAPVHTAPLSDPGLALDGRIVALDNRVDPATRSLTVEASIDNSADTLRAGMAIAITLDFVGEEKPSVDPLAIQWGSDGSFIWVVREDRAATLPVRILQRDAEAVLVEADLLPGDLVITEGAQSLRPGSEVAVIEPQS